MKIDSATLQYVKIFYSVVEDKSKTLDFLYKLEDAFKKSKEFRLAVSHPYINKDDKFKTIESVLNMKLGGKIKKFLNLLFKHNQIEKIEDIYKRFKQIHMKSCKIQPVRISTCKEIPESLLEELRTILENKTGKEIIPEVIVDKSLIAGIKVQIDDDVYDGSIKKVLEGFRDKVFQEVA